MRSEKEIKEIYKSVVRNMRYDIERPFEGINGHGEYWHHHCEDYEGKQYQEAYILLDYLETHLDEHLRIIRKEVGEIIEGEPRYSVEEIVKFAGSGQYDSFCKKNNMLNIGQICFLLKYIKLYPEKVKEFLEERKDEH